jgi:S-adenosylmethionine-diacylglycerol 3-amino-3-carboxypropyl transferase
MKAIAAWTTNRVFKYAHGNHLVYNACWEDPRLDREAMSLGPDDELVVITSAGCNALDYALDGPRKIHAVDMNFRQNALLELKLSGIRNLEFEEFFSLFGEGGHPKFPQWYHSRMRSGLSPVSKEFWDTRLHYFGRPTANASFYHRGTTGLFARIMVKFFKLSGVYNDCVRLFEAKSLEEQKQIYFGSIRDRLWRPPVKRALRTDVILSLLGVPKAQRDYLEKTCSQTVADFMEDCVEGVFTRRPIADNYFWRVYLLGRYSKDCCPEYLRQPQFERLKAGLVDRIQTHTSDLTSFFRKHPDPISRFVLLDHMDWLSHEHPQALADEWQAIIDKARPDARFLWRSGGFHVDYVDPIQVQYKGRSSTVGELLVYDTMRAADLHQRDRVNTYGSFYLARLAS